MMKKSVIQTLILVVIIFAILLISRKNSHGEYIKIAGFTQGTTYHITYRSTNGRNLQKQIDSLLADFDLSASIYLPNSIISKINKNNPNVLADEKFITLFKKSVEVNRKTNGAFDITVGPLVNAWGFGPAASSETDSSTIDSLLQYVGMEKVRLEGQRIIKSHPGIMLDFNAIAQGYSVDIVSKYLEKLGIKDYLVEIGGEVRTRGRNNKGNRWRIGIDKPIEGNLTPGENMQAILSPGRRALATSGNYRKFYEKDGMKYAHTINPATGYPVLSNLLSATVIAHDCITADAYATAFMVMGLEKTIAFLKKERSLDAYLIYSDEKGNFRVYCTKRIRKRIEEV